MHKRILVVDDDAAIGDVLQLILSDAGYEVEVQMDGHVVQQMTGPFPDLLFLDIRLSGMDGRTICEQFKNRERTRLIPIILLSANKDTQLIARDAGANDFLAKPFEIEDLLSLVTKYVGNK